MASINDRHRPRSTSRPRRDADGAADPHGARPPRLSRRRKRRLSREQRRQSARRAGLSCRQLKRISDQLPEPVRAVFEPLAPALTRPTHRRLVLLALLVRFPFCRRRWALPLLVALYRPEAKAIDGAPVRAHKTPVDLLGQMLRILVRWLPDRTFVCCADGNYAAHELAEVAAADARRLTFVSKFYPEANLFEPPPVPGKRPAHRPRKKGRELPAPAQVVRDTPKRPVVTVAWYGGQRRRVEVVTGTGSWYRSGRPLVPVRWVFVRDRSGTHRDDYFFTTDVAMSPWVVIETYTGRWNIETTFQEARSYLGLETTRGRARNTVLRAEPSLLALYALVVGLYTELPARYRRVRAVDRWCKADVTFSDAITAVRRYLWVEGVFSLSGHREAFEELGGPLRQILLQGLAPTA